MDNTTTKPPRLTWHGRNNRTATFNGHALIVNERNGQFFGTINGTKIGPYATEAGAKSALRRRATQNS